MNNKSEKWKPPDWDKRSYTKMLVDWLRTHPSAANRLLYERVSERMEDFMQQYQTGIRTEGVVETVKATYRFMDEIYSGNWHPEKDQVSCRRGCSFCCHINVDITIHEAEVLLEHAEQSNIPIDRHYLEGQAKIPDKNKQAQSTRFSACVFLKDSECSVYEMRPMSCRKHYVQSPPEKCDAGNGPLEILIYFIANIEMFISAVDTVAPGGSMAKMLLEVINQKKEA